MAICRAVGTITLFFTSKATILVHQFEMTSVANINDVGMLRCKLSPTRYSRRTFYKLRVWLHSSPYHPGKSMDNVPPENEIVIAFAGALSYGIYLLTLGHCLRWLLFADEGWTTRPKRNWSMITITILIFALVTTFLLLLAWRNTKTVHDIINHIPSNVPDGKTPWINTVIVSCK